MGLTRNERAAFLAALLRKDHETFSRYVENTVHLTKDEKIELLALDLQLVYGSDPENTIQKMLKIMSAEYSGS